MDLIHAQGLQSPPLSFHLVKDPEDYSLRPYYCMPLIAGANFPAINLCCRKKSNEDKYRFVYFILLLY